MENIFLAWLGHSDLKASQDSSGLTLGPVMDAVMTRSYTKVFLLSNHPRKTSRTYESWLSQRTRVDIKVKLVSLEDPMDFNKVYGYAREAVSEAQESWGRDSPLVFDLSPGTPAMVAVWIILAKTRFPQAELIVSGPRDEATGRYGMRTVSVPFDIAVEPIADIFGKRDDYLVRLLQGQPPEAPEFDQILHKCGAMKRVIALARTIASHNVPVLLLGESGTGKELIARAIHCASLRRDKPFIPVNCGAITPTLVESELFGHCRGAFTGAANERNGVFDQADKGTLFLDEISDLGLDLQVKLLRALAEGMIRAVGASSEHMVDVRIIAATHANMMERVAAGKFREDLFYRLAVGVIPIPPLRQREGDVSLLMEALLKKINAEFSSYPGYQAKGIGAGARAVLLRHDWPGNVRELENTLRRAAIWSAGPTIERRDMEEAIIGVRALGEDGILGRSLGPDLHIDQVLAQVAQHYMQRALRESGGNKTRAARLIGLANHMTFGSWMRKYGVKMPPLGGPGPRQSLRRPRRM
jgi:DNA-binding NtrC family response regulator